MNRRTSPFAFSVLLLVLTEFLALPSALRAQEQEQVKGTFAEPADAAEVRAQIATVEKLKSVVPDRGAVLYFLSTAKQHLGETLEALALLKNALLCAKDSIPPEAQRFGD